MNLTPSEKNQLERTLELQRIWYYKNREKVREKKRIWYQNNKEKANAMNKKWREKQRLEKEKQKQEEEITLVNFKVKKQGSLYNVLDVLRKKPRHYLWGKSVKKWTEKDWENFNLLKDIPENSNNQENYQNT